MGSEHGRTFGLSLCGELLPSSPTQACAFRNTTRPSQNTVLTTDQGGKFIIHVNLPKEYPFKPPILSFRTKIYHPNVTNDDRGAMCLGILKAEEWKPPNKVSEVLRLVRAVLATPEPDDAVETGIAEQLKNDRKGFEKTAKDWVTRYAK